MKYVIVFLILLCNIILFGQNKRDYIWFFGLDDYDQEIPGLQGVAFNFNNKPFEPKIIELGLGIFSNNTSICDKEGNLLFYSNGCAVLNSDNEVMPNGDSINPGLFFDKLWEGDCNNGYPGTQNIITLTDPANENGYYIIHKPKIKIEGQSSFTQDILYTYVDMTLNGGQGDVLNKNIVFYNEKKILSSYLTAIQHTNGIDWWILQPIKDSNSYLTFLLNSAGIHLSQEQIIGKVFHWNSSSSGTARFSPDGTKYALYNEEDGVLLFDFDRSTGLLRNYRRTVPEATTGTGIFCSVEWSPNSRFIYTASKNELYQVDTWEANMEDGTVLIDTYDGTKNPFSNTFFLMALAPDCRIYMCSTSGNKTYHVINNPNEKGLACNFDQNGLDMIYYNGGSMPNFPRWRVDEEEKCDSTIVSVFNMPVYSKKSLEVYPNPSSGIFKVRLPDLSSGKLTVMNINRQLIFEKIIRNVMQEEHIDISQYPVGRYFVEFYPDISKERVFFGVQVVKLK